MALTIEEWHGMDIPRMHTAKRNLRDGWGNWDCTHILSESRYWWYQITKQIGPPVWQPNWHYLLNVPPLKYRISLTPSYACDIYFLSSVIKLLNVPRMYTSSALECTPSINSTTASVVTCRHMHYTCNLSYQLGQVSRRSLLTLCRTHDFFGVYARVITYDLRASCTAI